MHSEPFEQQVPQVRASARPRCGAPAYGGAWAVREVLAPGGGPEAHASRGHRPKSVCRTPGELHRKSLDPLDRAEAEPWRLLALGRRVVHADDDGLADPELLPQDPL